MKPKKFLLLAMTLMLTLLFSMTAVFAEGEGEVDWERGVVVAKGYGVPNPKFKVPGAAKLAARDAAKGAAYAELLATIKGINVESNTTIDEYTTQSQAINLNVSGVVKGARVINEGWVDNDIYCVTMEVPIYGAKSVAGAVMQRPPTRDPLPEPNPNVQPSMPSVTTTTTTTTTITPSTPSAPTYTPSSGSTAIGGYTGVIIDCRGLGLKPVMSPVIKNDQGQPIYGYKNLDYDKVIEIGMAGYAYDFNGAGAARAGNNPLVIKAVGLQNHNGDPVISTADANRLLIENKASGFLDKLNVVFLR